MRVRGCSSRLDVKMVDAMCISVTKIHCPQFGEKKAQRLVLKFRIYDPGNLEGIVLPCFVRYGWKKAPLRSKLAKMAAVANHRIPVHMIRPSMFTGKMYRCKVVTSKTEPAYSLVETVLKRLAG